MCLHDNLSADLIAQLELGALAQRSYGHAKGIDITSLGLLEFSSYHRPTFFLLFDRAAHVVGYLAFDTIGKFENGDSHAYWDTILQSCPGVHQIFDSDKSLQITIVSGLVVDEKHRANGTARNLMTHGLSQVGPKADILIGLTKNPAAIRLRREVIQTLNDQGNNFQFLLWVGLQRIVGSLNAHEEEKAQQLVLLLTHLYSMLELHGWGMHDHPGVSVIPPLRIGSLPGMAYLPTDFFVEFAKLDPEAQQWLRTLYEVQPLQNPDVVALLPLIAISQEFMAAALSNTIASSEVFRTEPNSQFGRRYRRVLLKSQGLI